jgi:hypothetical protein
MDAGGGGVDGECALGLGGHPNYPMGNWEEVASVKGGALHCGVSRPSTLIVRLHDSLELTNLVQQTVKSVYKGRVQAPSGIRCWLATITDFVS